MTPLLQAVERRAAQTATLGQTLQVFRALLDAEEPPTVGDADAMIWAYLRSIQGLHAQTVALETLRRETIALDTTSAFKPRLLDNLDRHRQRLDEKPV